MPVISLPVRATLLSSALLILPLSALAQDSETVDLDAIILSAAGVATDSLTAPASVTVVTAEELERTGARDLTDALDGVPGLAVAGAADGENIYMRGLPAEYTLILIDGKRVNTRQSRTNGAGGVDQYYMPPVAAIERIEVVRGPMSSLYGSDAMGGVINIITKPASPDWTGSVTVEGTLPEHGVDSEQQQLSFYLSGPAVSDRVGVQLWGRKLMRTASERVEDGDEVGPGARDLTDLHARLNWTPSDDHEVSLELGDTKIQTGTLTNRRGSGALDYHGFVGAWELTGGLSLERARRTREGSARAPRIDTTELEMKASRGLSWQGEHALTLGAQFQRAELTDFNPGLDDDVNYSFANDQLALFAEDIWEITPALSATFGARYTDDERFGGKLTPRAYLLWEASDGLFLSAGASAGYRTPELRQSVEGYYYTTNRGRAVIAGTPDLAPEESVSYELGLRYEGARLRFAATAYHTDFSDKIETRDTGGTTEVNGTSYDLYEYYNVGKARLSGFELSAGYQITPDLDLSGSYSYSESKRLTGDLAGQPLSRTPRHQASLRLDWHAPVDGLDLWGKATYFGDSVAISSTSRGNTVSEYDGYTTLDLGLSYAVSDSAVLNAAIYNATDAEITDAENGVAAQGRTLWLGLTSQF